VAATIGCFVGIALWMAITGPIARELPVSWQMPEGFAARTMGASMWDAGKKLMAAADPETWNAVVADKMLVDDNVAAIAACRKTAVKAGKRVRCAIEVGPA